MGFCANAGIINYYLEFWLCRKVLEHMKSIEYPFSSVFQKYTRKDISLFVSLMASESTDAWLLALVRAAPEPL